VNRYLRMLALVGILAIVAAACGRGGGGPTQEETEGGLPRGGTLIAGLESDVDAAFDPQKEYYSVTWGFYHCCLLRTLMATPTVPAEEGGNDLLPDLATDVPEVSEDGLTYTFTIRDGITWAPPLEDQEIVAGDFINAMEREADPKVTAGYPFYYSVIEGFDSYRCGLVPPEVIEGTPDHECRGVTTTDTITGMTAVDDKTLEITLTRPSGDLPYRMAMHAAAPIPEGAEEGHEKDYGRFLVSSGPYMFEGSEDLDFDAPAEEQEPVAGYDPGRSIVLVRNPSWSADTDPFREAHLDRIEVQIGITTADGYNKIDTGEMDVMLDAVPPPQVIQQFQADPEREDQVFSYVNDAVYYASFNLAEPPFDDIHVRKAVNFATDKASMLTIRGGPLFGEPAGHNIIDSLLGDQLADYDPYESPDSQGDIEAAQAEMAQSEYDTDGDGVCDAPECTGIVSVTDEADPYPDQARVWQQSLEPLGLELDMDQFERTTMYDKCLDPGAHVAFCAGPGWGKDYPDATTFGEPLFGSAALFPECCNYSLVGASPEFLEEHGYEVTEVPSVDEQITECDALDVGEERTACFAELDQQLMEDVVPWVPLTFTKDVYVISDRLLNFKYDQFSGAMALDQAALAGGGAEA
jgi:peptide/nickel transport system substrate-binding protein